MPLAIQLLIFQLSHAIFAGRLVLIEVVPFAADSINRNATHFGFRDEEQAGSTGEVPHLALRVALRCRCILGCIVGLKVA